MRFYVMCDDFVDGGHESRSAAERAIQGTEMLGACTMVHWIVEAHRKMSPESVRREWRAQASQRHPSAS